MCVCVSHFYRIIIYYMEIRRQERKRGRTHFFISLKNLHNRVLRRWKKKERRDGKKTVENFFSFFFLLRIQLETSFGAVQFDFIATKRVHIVI